MMTGHQHYGYTPQFCVLVGGRRFGFHVDKVSPVPTKDMEKTAERYVVISTAFADIRFRNHSPAAKALTGGLEKIVSEKRFQSIDERDTVLLALRIGVLFAQFQSWNIPSDYTRFWDPA